MQKLQRILVGIDFEHDHRKLTAGSRVAAEQALRLAARTGAKVDFLHSTHLDAEAEEATASPPWNVEEVLGLLQTELSRPVEVDSVTLTDERPWVALIQAVLAGKSDLIVVAKRNRAEHDGRKLGSVSLKLVRKCPAPVWVVRPEKEVNHQCIVAATDLSPVGDLATDYGAFLADAENCELCVVHAWQVPMELQMSAARLGMEETAARKKAIADEAAAHIRALAPVSELGDRAALYLTCDSPSHAILQLAEEKQPDLVVMGTISRGGIAGVLVGNTAEKLLDRLDCSLLTVKPDDFVCPLSLEPAEGKRAS